MKLYTRVALGMLLALVLSVTATHYLVVLRVKADASEKAQRHVAASVATIAEQLRDPDARKQRLDVLAQRFGFTLEVVPLAAERARGPVPADAPLITERDGKNVAVIALSGDKALVVGGLPHMPHFPVRALLGLLTSIAIVMITAFLVVGPVLRRLRALERATAQLRAGDLSTRVPEDSGDAIGTLGASINHMASEIERLVDRQTELLQAVSHEFRTPIARIRFAVEMLATDETEESRDKRMDSIDQNLTELDSLVEEILTYGKLDSDAVSLSTESIDVGKAVDDIVGATEVLRDRVEIGVLAHDDKALHIEANRRYFTRVVENLVLNAIRHAKTKVQVEYQRVGEVVLIVINDDGPGVPKEQRDKVWEPFARLDSSRSRDSGGFGLGLAIVRRIMAWHGGAARVEDSQLGGAMFVTSWPIDAPAKGK